MGFLVAKADREKAAINLHKANNRQRPGHLRPIEANTPVTQKEPVDQKLLSRLNEHRDTLKAIRHLRAEYWEGGQGESGEMINANNAYINAELELAESPQQTLAVLHEALKLHAHVEHVAAVKHEVGTIRLSEYLLAKAARMKSEIELNRALKRSR